MPRFAANLGYLFTERPLLERIDAAAAAGFKAIELQFPYDVPADAVKAAIERNTTHHSRPQYAAGSRGRIRPCRRAGTAEGVAGPVHPCARLCERDRRERDSLSRRQGCARAASGRRSRLYRQSGACRRSCRREKNQLLIEPINGRDRPNYFLNHVEHAAAVIERRQSPISACSSISIMCRSWAAI